MTTSRSSAKKAPRAGRVSTLKYARALEELKLAHSLIGQQRSDLQKLGEANENAVKAMLETSERMVRAEVERDRIREGVQAQLQRPLVVAQRTITYLGEEDWVRSTLKGGLKEGLNRLSEINSIMVTETQAVSPVPVHVPTGILPSVQNVAGRAPRR